MSDLVLDDRRDEAYACLAHGIAHALDEIGATTVAGILGSIALDIASDPEGWRESLRPERAEISVG